MHQVDPNKSSHRKYGLARGVYTLLSFVNVADVNHDVEVKPCLLERQYSVHGSSGPPSNVIRPFRRNQPLSHRTHVSQQINRIS